MASLPRALYSLSDTLDRIHLDRYIKRDARESAAHYLMHSGNPNAQRLIKLLKNGTCNTPHIPVDDRKAIRAILHAMEASNPVTQEQAVATRMERLSVGIDVMDKIDKCSKTLEPLTTKHKWLIVGYTSTQVTLHIQCDPADNQRDKTYEDRKQLIICSNEYKEVMKEGWQIDLQMIGLVTQESSSSRLTSLNGCAWGTGNVGYGTVGAFVLYTLPGENFDHTGFVTMRHVAQELLDDTMVVMSKDTDAALVKVEDLDAMNTFDVEDGLSLLENHFCSDYIAYRAFSANRAEIQSCTSDNSDGKITTRWDWTTEVSQYFILYHLFLIRLANEHVRVYKIGASTGLTSGVLVGLIEFTRSSNPDKLRRSLPIDKNNVSDKTYLLKVAWDTPLKDPEADVPKFSDDGDSGSLVYCHYSFRSGEPAVFLPLGFHKTSDKTSCSFSVPVVSALRSLELKYKGMLISMMDAGVNKDWETESARSDH